MVSHEARRPEDAVEIVKLHLEGSHAGANLELLPNNAQAAAEDVIARLRSDNTWTSLPSVADLQHRIAQATEVSSDGENFWLSRLEQMAASVMYRALNGASAAQPVVRVSAAVDRMAVRCVPIDRVDEAYLILADRGFLRYTSLTVRAVVESLPEDFFRRPYSPAEIDSHIKRRIAEEPERTVFPFAEAAVEVAISGTPLSAGSFPVRPGLLNMTYGLFYATDLFWLGHEMAHFELGHARGPRPVHETLRVQHTTDPIWRELQADELGMSICAHALGEARIAPMPHVTLGGWLFFAALRAKELAAAVYRAENIEEGVAAFDHAEANRTGTYPTVTERKRALLNTLGQTAQSGEMLQYLWQSFDQIEKHYLGYVSDHANRMRDQIG